MKNLFLLFALLTLSAGLWAETQMVSYLKPVYSETETPFSDFVSWKTETVTATVVENSTDAVTWTEGWYVVTGTDVQLTKGAICQGNVHLILADGAKLTAIDPIESNIPAAGIQVSDENSLTIYAQSTDPTTMGQLIATGGEGNQTGAAGIGGMCIFDGIGQFLVFHGSNITINGGIITATGGNFAAGIGGGFKGNGSNITINGGIVIATGGAGAAGIGGGVNGDGSNITINGGIVSANGDSGHVGNSRGDGIGGGYDGVGSNISVYANLRVRAGTNAMRSNDIIVEHTSTQDIANDLEGKQYVTIGSPAVPNLITIAYVDEHGGEYTVNAWEVKNSYYYPVTWCMTGITDWYVVIGEDVELSAGAVCQGDVHLILADGAKLMTTGGNLSAGIQVSGEGNSLTIYAQSTDPDKMGQLIATGGIFASAGIGGGSESNGSNITINGGMVIATGGVQAAGIGGGQNGSGSDITINGGEVIATGGQFGAGIGGGCSGSGSNITINGGNVTAIGGDQAIGIGNGKDATNPASNIKVATTLVVKAGASAIQMEEITNEGGDLAGSLTNKQYVTIGTPSTTIWATYIDEKGEPQTTIANIVVPFDPNTSNPDDPIYIEDTYSITWGEEGKTTWYVVIGTDVQLTQGAICQGDVRLILSDGAKLTATGIGSHAGIEVSGEGNSLTIYGQFSQSGRLLAEGGANAAGIGGEVGDDDTNSTIDGSNITINGGMVIATGGVQAAGIGGGHDGDGSNITINGGKVTAQGGEHAAGIGGGDQGNGSNITINGGTVTATGGEHAAGIGNGYFGNVDYGSASDIYISDAYVFYAGESETLTDVDIVAHSSATDLSNNIRKRYVKVEGLATPYTRTVTKDQWGTVCLPYAATSFSGATFYKVNYYDASNPSDLKLYIEPVTTLAAGMPYIFEATATGTLTINHSATTPMDYGDEQTDGRGLYGSFARTVIASDGDMAAISGGQVVIVENGYKLTVPACRAYLDMTEVPTTEQPHSAPLRVMGARQTPTGVEMHDSQCTMRDGKYIIKGHFVIVKDGKMYNAQGIEL